MRLLEQVCDNHEKLIITMDQVLAPDQNRIKVLNLYAFLLEEG